MPHRRRPEGNGRPLREDEKFGLPRHWQMEIQETAREGTGAQVAGIISRSIEAFTDGDFVVSAELAREAKALAPRSTRTMELLGLAYYHQGQWKDALRELLTYRRLTAAVDQNHVIADAYRATGRPDRALEVCAEVPQKGTDPQTWVETMIVAAGALADKGDVARAIAMLNRADPESETVEDYQLRLWYVIADLMERSNRVDDAAEYWERIVAEDPDFFDVQERLQRRGARSQGEGL